MLDFQFVVHFKISITAFKEPLVTAFTYHIWHNPEILHRQEYFSGRLLIICSPAKKEAGRRACFPVFTVFKQLGV